MPGLPRVGLRPQPATHLRQLVILETAAFPTEALFTTERARPAIGPRKLLGTIVTGEHHDRVVLDAKIFQLFEALPIVVAMKQAYLSRFANPLRRAGLHFKSE